MTLNAGTATVEIRGDLDPLKRDMGTVDDLARRAGAQTGTQFASGLSSPATKSKMAGAASTLKNVFYLAGGVALAQGLKRYTFDAARESRTIMADVNQVIETTGNVANVTADEMDHLATRMAYLSGIDDEAILSSEALLRTFTKVRNEVGAGNDIFTQASKAMLNVSVRMKTDLQSAALQVGKALNDPVRGMTALSRAGIQFDDEQKDLIKTLVESGNIIGAQKVILKELETQTGGAAEAAGRTNPYARLQVRLENLGETIGSKTLPGLDALATGLIKVTKGAHPYQRAIEDVLDVGREQAEATWGSVELVAAYEQQLMSGAISLDQYTEKVNLQIKALLEQAAAGKDFATAAEALRNIELRSENVMARYQARLESMSDGFAGATRTGAALAMTMAQINALADERSRYGGGSSGGGGGGGSRGGGGSGGNGGGGGVIPWSVAPSVVHNNLVLNLDARGSSMTEAQYESISRRVFSEITSQAGRRTVRQQRSRTSFG